MTKKELYQLLHANGVPINVYKWDFSELPENSMAARKFTPILEDIEGFLKSKKTIVINFSNYLLSARIAATFLKAAYIAGYYDSYYTVPANIIGYKVEQWDNGDAYAELVNADFLVVDKVKSFPKTASDSTFAQATYDDFVEERLLRDRATVFVAVETPQFCFSERNWKILAELGGKIYADGGVANAK